jgi:hypothetical protein
MRFLSTDVVEQRLKVGRTDGEGTVPALRGKMWELLRLEPLGGRCFDHLDEISDGRVAREADSKMDVIGGATHAEAFTTGVSRDSGEIGVERGTNIGVENGVAVFRRENSMHEQEREGLRHCGDYRSGLQPWFFFRERTWGVAPGWYSVAPLALVFAVAFGLIAGCKSGLAPKVVAPQKTIEPASVYPTRPAVVAPVFKVFHVHDAVVTLVTKTDATDDEIEAILWELRDAAHAKTLNKLKVSQKMVDDRAPLVWFHVYRGTKCAAEKYADGDLPCGNRYNGAGDYTYGGYANKELDRGVIRDGDKETELWDAEKVYEKGS